VIALDIEENSAMPYLVHDIFERIWAVDGETDEEEIGFWVGQRAESIVFLLSCCVPESELESLARYWVDCVGNVVLKYGRNIFLSTN
jgi:hypothetical protein